MKIKSLERNLKALANKRRLAILKYLKTKKEAPVNVIARAAHVSIKATSKHLSVLLAANVLEKEQRGMEVYYFIAAQPADEIKYLLQLI